jgi:hypothetical protein
VETLYRNPGPRWVELRGPLFFLPSNPSFMTISGLERDVRASIDPAVVAGIAEESRAGRALIIGATNLDLGRQRVWNLGGEAERAQAGGSPDRLCRMLLASAAIPGVFPPVELDGFLYGDGGVTANVLLRLDPSNPEAVFARWRREHPDEPLPRVRFWVIVNNQLSHRPRTVQAKWPAVIGPSLATSIRHATVAEVRWLAAQAGYMNSVFGTDVEVRVVAIPQEWRAPVPGDFQKATMDSLADLGRKMGADPRSWTVWTDRLTVQQAAPGELPPDPEAPPPD